MNKDVVILGCDIGRSRCNIYGVNGYEDEFLSCVGDYRILRNGRKVSSQDSIITVDDKTYFVGLIAKEEGDASQNMSKSKVHLDTKILALTAVARAVNDGSDIFVVIPNPIGNQSETEKMSLRNLLIGEHSVIINGEKRSFTISRVEVGVEGGAIVWALETNERQYHVFDIGSTTFNFATFKSKNWIDRYSDTVYQGVETLPNYTHERMARLCATSFYKKVRQQYGSIYVVGGVANRISTYLLREGLVNVRVPDNPSKLLSKSLYNLGVHLHEKSKGETVNA